jgi:hypothetical protein
MEKQIENLATIKYCIERIEEKLLQSSLESRWLWETRLKIAQYVHSYLMLHDKNKESERLTLSDEHKQEIIKNHPLLQPFDQVSIGITSEQRNKIQKEIYDKVHKMYFFFEKS